jgi:hypothetical protein
VLPAAEQPAAQQIPAEAGGATNPAAPATPAAAPATGEAQIPAK